MKQYYGQETTKALHNFHFSYPPVALQLIYAIVQIKKAAALANADTKFLDRDISNAIIQACDEILMGKLDSQFRLCAIQGGAGTSINMNVNEVVASRAEELLKKKKNTTINPLDHVNMHQSTNDVNPSALRIALLQLCLLMTAKTNTLIEAFERISLTYKNDRKLARTHMQDAVPITFGQEFGSYRDIIKADLEKIHISCSTLYKINLGGTAVGSGINCPQSFQTECYKNLNKQTGFALRPGDNKMSLTSGNGDFLFTASSIHILMLDLSKIATDLRFLSSGPHGGIGEIHLQELQKGSSIMPGKINPIIPESINQLYYIVSGKITTLFQAAESSHLELSVMFPVIADALISSMLLVIEGVEVFTKCVNSIRIDKKQAIESLDRSSAYAVLFIKKLGYQKVSDAVKKAIAESLNLREVFLKDNLISAEEFDRIIADYHNNGC